ncbi:ribosomal-protein-alanine N-acetyltransferase [Devosia crocina]|uniref:Ribosomal-protein-alanine N-acetyltransferase n=1 Tax=Devosia crocina TaxID=429728 RepID=A0A1I7NBG5_9HYPH|nr:GNAT family N-acetyltransferase [Devosia crocina]SFV31998.1 ribosomal-protein-alanine N-acetyltransferase [Devosia crocina]
MITRRAQTADAPTLGAIGIAAWRESAFGRHDAGRTDGEKLHTEFIDFCAAHPHTILVGEEGGTLLGWGARELSDETISDLWVAPEAQGRGVGAALLAALEEAIALEGFAHAELETYAGNAGAVRFYSRQGYEPIWRGLKFSASLNYDLDKIRFRKPLREAA